MLEHLPHWLGAALRSVRAGADKLIITQPVLGHDYATIEVTSPAFAREGRIPPRFTADGDGVSPPLTWGAVPPGTLSVALVVEDADSPTPSPLVHAILWGLPADAGRIEEGAIVADAHPDGGGRRSYEVPKPLANMMTMPLKFPTGMVHGKILYHAHEPKFWLYSRVGILNQLAFARNCPGIAWETPGDVSDGYQKSLGSWELQDYREPRTARPLKRWVQVFDRDDKLFCEAYILQQAEMAGFLSGVLAPM